MLTTTVTRVTKDRATKDIQLIIDLYACVEYLVKYVFKADSISSLAQEIFVHAMNNVSEPTTPESDIRKLMLSCEGEKDIGVKEIMH